MTFNILLKIKPTKLPGKLYAIPFERVDKADTLQTESSLSELSVENQGLKQMCSYADTSAFTRAALNRASPCQGAVFALHARENRVFYVRGEIPSDQLPKFSNPQFFDSLKGTD